MQKTKWRIRRITSAEAKQTEPWKSSHDIGDFTWKVMESLKGIIKRRGTVISLTSYFYQMRKLKMLNNTVLVWSEELLLSSSKISFSL